MVRFAVVMYCSALVAIHAGSACSQTSSAGSVSIYPVKPIRILTTGVGGATDFASRLIAQGLTESMGQQVIVDNRASAAITGDVVAKSPRDGYTLLMMSASLWISPLLQDTSYDPVRDFSPINLVATSPTILVVHPSMPVKSVRELIVLAKSRSGKMNYAAAQIGSTNHLAGELFKSMARVNIVAVPYKGSALALNALLTGEVQLSFAPAGSVTGQLKSGRLKALAVTSAQPSVFFPGMPTVASSGVPGYEAESTYGVFAPAQTLAAIVNRLNQEIARFLVAPGVKEKFFGAGQEVVGSGPEQLGAKVKAEIIRLGKVIKDAGIREKP